jgi:hypothetical protein
MTISAAELWRKLLDDYRRVLFLFVVAVLAYVLTAQLTVVAIAFCVCIVRPSSPVFDDLRWRAIVAWTCIALLLTLFVFLLFGSSGLNLPDGQAFTVLKNALYKLSTSPSSGLSYPLAVALAVTLLFSACWMSMNIGDHLSRASTVLEGAMIEAYRKNGPSPMSLLAKSGAVVVIYGIAFLIPEAWLVLHAGLRVTVFGRMADYTAFTALVATTIIGPAMLMGAVAVTDHIVGLCKFIEATPVFKQRESTSPNRRTCWDIVPGERPTFATTPVLAGFRAGGWPAGQLEDLTEFERLKSSLGRALSTPANEASPPVSAADVSAGAPTAADLRTIYALLTIDIHCYHLTVLGSILSVIASSAIIYLFPVSQDINLILINVGTLVIVGLYSAYNAVQFETNGVLSNVLCNQPEKANWSLGLFGYIIIPLVVLALVITVMQVPGVLDFGGGFWDLLLGFLHKGGDK